MEEATALGAGLPRAADSPLLGRFALLCLVFVLLAAVITLGGHWAGREVLLSGVSDATTAVEMTLGDDVLTVPANVIRFAQQRRPGAAERLDLFLRWPDMAGYSAETRSDFNHGSPERKILFLSLERQIMSRDMSGRFALIYQHLIVKPGVPAPGGVTLYGFTDATGYRNEVLAVAERGHGEAPFVARCLTGAEADESLAPCQRDLLVGHGLSLSYRFPRTVLPDWKALDAAVLATTAGYLKRPS